MLALEPRIVLDAALGATVDDTQTSSPDIGAVLASVRFESNEGQADAVADFIARTETYTIGFTDEEVIFALRGEEGTETLTMTAVGGEAVAPVGEAPLSAYWNYYGPDGAIEGVTQWGSIRYNDIYAGIDQVFHAAADGLLEYDFIVDPYADASQIALQFDGADSITIAEDGSLNIRFGNQTLTQYAPAAYQHTDGVLQSVTVSFTLLDGNMVGFELGEYDAARTLVIDPVVEYANTFNGVELNDVAVDDVGNVYLVGTAGRGNNLGLGEPGGRSDAVVLKLDADYNLLWGSYIGGSGDEYGYALDLDWEGNVWIVGETWSDGLATGDAVQGALAGNVDAFVARLDGAGSVNHFSYLGGDEGDGGAESGLDIAVAGDHIAVLGTTDATGFLPENAWEEFGKGFVALIDPDTPDSGTLVFGSHLADDHSVNAIASDGEQVVIVGSTGGDVAITRFSILDPEDREFTTVGGYGRDEALGVAMDGDGYAYVIGTTSHWISFDWDEAWGELGEYDAFLIMYDTAWDTVDWVTVIGGSGNDVAYSVSIAWDDTVFIGGQTDSADLPVFEAVQYDLDSVQNGFIAAFDPWMGEFIFCTYVGSGAVSVHGLDAGYADRVVAVGSSGPGDDFLVGIDFADVLEEYYDEQYWADWDAFLDEWFDEDLGDVDWEAYWDDWYTFDDASWGDDDGWYEWDGSEWYWVEFDGDWYSEDDWFYDDDLSWDELNSLLWGMDATELVDQFSHLPAGDQAGSLLRKMLDGNEVDYGEYRRTLGENGIDEERMRPYLLAYDRMLKESRTKLYSGALQELSENPFAADAFGELPQAPLDEEEALERPGEGRRVAIFIGIEQYANGVPKLNTPIADVQALAALFDDKFGFEAIVLANPSKQQLIEDLSRVAAGLKPGDSLVVYYAGHGYSVPQTGLGFWLPADATPAEATSWVSTRDLTNFLAGARSNQVMIMSDSCYSGALIRSPGGESGTLPIEEILKRRSVVVMSSGGDEPVRDDGMDGHSVFAGNLLQSLRQVDDSLVARQVYDDVRDKVARMAAQTPHFGFVPSAGHDSGGDFVFQPK